MTITLPHRGAPPSTPSQAVPEAPATRVVAKPVPDSQARDPRGYQIAQLRRRYAPRESLLADGSTSLAFKLAPSDPDFPFDLAHLECDIRVPAGYPESRPSLRVAGGDLPRGFAINVERGWDRLAAERKGATLLALTNLLDKNLEGFLAEEKADTVKLVANKDTRHVRQQEQQQQQLEPHSPKAAAKPPPAAVKKSPPRKERPAYVREPSFTREEVAAAKARRAQETRQLEARMGRAQSYSKSSDGVVYTLPLEPGSRGQLPPGLRDVRTVYLIVPLLYPLQQLRVQLNEAEADDAGPVEELFALKAAEQRKMNLTSHLNYLAVNLHVLAKMAAFQARVEEKEEEDRRRREEAVKMEGKGKDKEEAEGGEEEPVNETEEFVKSHIKVIPRPPEWGYDSDSGSDSDDWSAEGDSGGSDSSGGEHDDDGAQTTATAASPNQTVEKGTAILFPGIELYNIELLQLTVLNLSVKCARCKTTHDITGLRDGVSKTDSCSKCTSLFAASYAQEAVHQGSVRAGLVDVGGCTVADVLPSTFVAVCAGCSSPAAGFVAVRGDASSHPCRECHARLTLKLPEVKLLRVSAGSLAPSADGLRRKGAKDEKLGLRAGEPLPDRGTCEHYRKSHRWFRFSCCARVYPCDRCHDAAEGHHNEWASRMICGFCSREQRYAVDACGFCGRSVVGRKGSGFWEGGRGTRDRRMMSRKDGRKYRRVGGGEAAAVAAAKKE